MTRMPTAKSLSRSWSSLYVRLVIRYFALYFPKPRDWPDSTDLMITKTKCLLVMAQWKLWVMEGKQFSGYTDLFARNKAPVCFAQQST